MTNIYVYFNSLLDPSDASKGTFRQKAYIGFAGYDKPNCLATTGYELSSEKSLTVQNAEFENAFILNGNLVAVEHRYFGESVPTETTMAHTGNIFPQKTPPKICTKSSLLSKLS